MKSKYTESIVWVSFFKLLGLKNSFIAIFKRDKNELWFVYEAIKL